MSSPPDCNPACQKIILNSGNITLLTRFTRKRMRAAPTNMEAKAEWNEITEICDRADAAVASLEQGKHPTALTDEEKAIVITSLNHHENEVCRAQVLFLKAVGYDGPTGKMLQ